MSCLSLVHNKSVYLIRRIIIFVAAPFEKPFCVVFDKETGVSYEHRRDWIEKRIFQLSQVFAIDICAHAVMNNHLHLVLHVNVEQVKNWTTLEVLTRWHKLFKGTLLTKKYQLEQPLTEFEMKMVEETAQVYKSD